MSEAQLLDFVRWHGTDAMALVDQLRARVKACAERGETVGFIAVLVTPDAEGAVNYSPCYTTMPPEIMGWAARILSRVADNITVPSP